MKHSNLVVGNNGYKEINEYLKAKKPSVIFLLVDENTHQHCVPLFLPEIETESIIETIEIESGEINKNIETAQSLWSVLLELDADRNSVIINLGGGVITDLGGFVASTFKRGIEFINVPTSLLAMVDAAVGGKTGVNFEGSKNQIGTISAGNLVLIDTNFLHTLPYEELKSGFAEMLKHGLIADVEHWNQIKTIKKLEVDSIAPYIIPSIKIKEEIASKDPNEKGERKILNFGHTVGHALESQSLLEGNILKHGHAVAIGMIIESILSVQLGLLKEKDHHEIYYFLSEIYELNKIEQQKIPEIIQWIKLDKKNEQNQFKFTLLESIGKATYNVSVTEEQVIEAIEKFNLTIN